MHPPYEGGGIITSCAACSGAATMCSLQAVTEPAITRLSYKEICFYTTNFDTVPMMNFYVINVVFLPQK